MAEGGRVIVITGAMAAGKSTVAELLARRLPSSVHVRGDVFRKMVVNGRVDMSPDAGPEAMDQLHLPLRPGRLTPPTRTRPPASTPSCRT